MLWAQDYAALNRDVMLHLVKRVFAEVFGDRFSIAGEVINCHHNFSSLEEHAGERIWITRKGALQARWASFLARWGPEGRCNHDSYCSCLHGAGRVMSRGAAKRAFTVDHLIAQTASIECGQDEAVIDEIPAAYKDIDAVMAAQADLVQVRHTIRQVLCIKGGLQCSALQSRMGGATRPLIR